MALSLGRKHARSTTATAYGPLAVMLLLLLFACFGFYQPRASAQEDELNRVHVPPPPPKPDPTLQPAPLEGDAALTARRGERIRVDVNLVLVPLIVTDPMDRLVTGLEKEFDVKIPDADLVPERFDTVSKIEAYIDSRKS